LTQTLQSAVWGAGFITNEEYCSLQCKRDAVCISTSRCQSGAQPTELEQDVAGVCADCSGFSGLTIAQTPDNLLNLPTKIIEATFSLSDGRPRSVYFHMQDGEDGWRVDNIVGPDGFNLQKIAFQKGQGQGISTYPFYPSDTLPPIPSN
jgi:hypothetical protein